MSHHPIFESFSRTETETSGLHVYDFLGGGTRVAYNRGWATHAHPAGKTVTSNLPTTNEHYLDWIAVLTAVSKAQGTFRMAEFGAGWAPWLARGALAARQKGVACELLAVEADPTHFAWAREHFKDNGIDPDAHNLIEGAVSDKPETLRFPVIADPDVDYGASLRVAATMADTIEVRGYTINELLDRFTGPIDFLHIDIQGAEYDAVPPVMERLSASVRAIMIGTHINDEMHDGMAARFHDAGWKERLNLGRNRDNDTPWGEIRTNDGFLWFENGRAV